MKITWFDVTAEDRLTFQTDPLDLGISSHTFTRRCHDTLWLNRVYVDGFGMIGNRIWVRWKELGT